MKYTKDITLTHVDHINTLGSDTLTVRVARYAVHNTIITIYLNGVKVTSRYSSWQQQLPVTEMLKNAVGWFTSANKIDLIARSMRIAVAVRNRTKR